MNIRSAGTGDKGTLVAAEWYGSIGALLIQIDEAEQARLFGDWRMIRDIIEALEGEQVEVIDGGADGPAIRPLSLD